MNLQELNRFYLMLTEAEKLELDGNMRNNFNIQLINYLKEELGEELTISDKGVFGYLEGTYKNVKFDLKTVNGIVLSIKDENNKHLISDFVLSLNDVVGQNPICGYDFYQYDENGRKKCCPTVEWNLEPHARLESLVMQAGSPLNNTIKNFEDYYLTSIISALGTGIFTIEGYDMIFNTSHSNTILIRHRLQQIQKVFPDMNMNLVYSWYKKCREEMERVNSK